VESSREGRTAKEVDGILSSFFQLRTTSLVLMSQSRTELSALEVQMCDLLEGSAARARIEEVLAESVRERTTLE
jgi:hypothetical protein